MDGCFEELVHPAPEGDLHGTEAFVGLADAFDFFVLRNFGFTHKLQQLLQLFCGGFFEVLEDHDVHVVPAEGVFNSLQIVLVLEVLEHAVIAAVFDVLSGVHHTALVDMLHVQ